MSKVLRHSMGTYSFGFRTGRVIAKIGGVDYHKRDIRSYHESYGYLMDSDFGIITCSYTKEYVYPWR